MSTSPPDGTVLRHPDPDEPLSVRPADLREMVTRGALEWGAEEATAETLGLDVSSALRRKYAERVERRAVTRNVSDIEPREVRWLWHNRIPYGMLSEVCGDPGEGKSHLTLAIATAGTLGLGLPGDPEGGVRVPGHVLLVCMEDSPEATVRPRLEGMGADLTRVTILDGFRGENGEADPLDLSRVDHRFELRRLVQELDVTLVVIDPVTAHLGGANEWKDSEVRSVLAPLARMADETGAAVILVRHLRKSDSSRAIYRAGGSIAFTASVRSSLMVGRPKGEETQRAVVRVKGNLSPEPPAVGFVLDENGWGWTDVGEWTAADLLRGDTSGEERTQLDEAMQFLSEELAPGPLPAKELQQRAKDAGHHIRTLRRAADRLGVTKRKAAFTSGWEWRLPAKGTGSPKASEVVPLGAPEGRNPPPAKDEHEGDTPTLPLVPFGPKGTTKWTGDVPFENAQAGEGFTGGSDAEGDNGRHIDRCADCERSVPSDPTFKVLRCVPCGMKAGKEARDHA